MTFAFDLRMAVRFWLRRPVLFLSVGGCLAVAFAVATAVMSTADSAFFRALPFPRSDALMVVRDYNAQRSPDAYGLTPSRFEDLGNRVRAFDALAATQLLGANLAGPDGAVRIQAAEVSATLFPMLGIRAHLGRLLQDTDAGERVAVLSYGLWRLSFRGDPRTIGATVKIDGEPFTVIGVLGPGAQCVFDADVWTPLPAYYLRGRSAAHSLHVLARARANTTTGQVSRELRTLSRDLERAFPESDRGWAMQAVPLRDHLYGRLRPSLAALVLGAWLLMMSACTSVMVIVMAGSSARRQEIAIRSALGAGRWRLVRQACIEGVVLAAPALLCGLLAARALTTVSSIPGPLPYGIDLQLSPMLAGWLAVVGLCAMIASAIPIALSGATLNLAEYLRAKGGVTNSGRPRFELTLASIQVALAVMLLTSAALVGHGLLRLYRIAPGFVTDNLLTCNLTLNHSKYPHVAERERFYERLIATVSAIPGVQGAAIASSIPFAGKNIEFRFLTETADDSTAAETHVAQYRSVSTDYPRVMGIPVVEGASFDTAGAARNATSVLVNREMARRFWPGVSAVGRRLSLDGPNGPWLTIVGVVGNVNQFGLETAVRPEMYRHMSSDAWPFATVVVRSNTPPESLSDRMRAAIKVVDPEQPIYDVATMPERIRASGADRALVMKLLAAFALGALALAAVAVYGIVSRYVSDRGGEIAIRAALGAKSNRLVAQSMLPALAACGAGLVAGMLGALAAGPLLSGVLFQIGAADPATLSATAGLMMLVAVIASYVPARRAAMIDPSTALRQQ